MKMARLDRVHAEKALADAKDLDWYNKFEIELDSGIYTPGRLDTQGYGWRRDFLGLTPDYLKGKRVLDIGAYSGAFSFLLQDLGAEVVAVDVYDPDFNGFSLVRDLRKRELQHHRISVYDLNPETLGYLDIVAFYGVHYHLRHPLLAFERCNSVCKDGGLLAGGGTGLDSWFHDDDESCAKGVNIDGLTADMVNNEKLLSVSKISDLPFCGFSPNQFLRDKTNWFIPSMTCLSAWVESSGFEVKDTHKNSMPVLRDWNEDRKIRRTSLNRSGSEKSDSAISGFPA
jgi:tRNA (mo5U34)-methyltransferase